MIDRLRGRTAFTTLSRTGARARTTSLWCRYCPEPHGPLRVGYAFGRSTGNAVARNRVRRRVRAILDEVDRRHEIDLHGALLIGATGPHVTGLTYAELRSEVVELLGRCRRRNGA